LYRAGLPGLTGLVLVFALDLKNVKEIGCCGVNFNQIVIRPNLWIGKLGDVELAWFLYMGIEI
jgi:hypothetical protein